MTLDKKIKVDTVDLPNSHATIDVLRLDLVHPVISGNKWFKLKEYLKEARQLNKKALLTFGGAYSNHIVATAAAAQLRGFKSVGVIRGEEPAELSATLKDALNFGMELFYASREAYKSKIIPADVFEVYNEDEMYIINEGGYGIKGMEGVKSILEQIDASVYTQIVVAVGTGTTLAGLKSAVGERQKVIGISVMKNNISLRNEIEVLLPTVKRGQFELLHDYAFGGYAKFNQELIQFMNDWYRLTAIPSDFVYTGKLFFAVNDRFAKNMFSEKDKVLVIHSGGIQGNRSLPKGTLIF